MTDATDPQAVFQQGTPEDQQSSVLQAIQGMSPEQRAELANVLNQHPATNVQPDDHDAMAGALVQHAQTEQQAAQQGQESPLQAAFGSGGLFGSPVAKAALVAAAGILGSKLLRH